MNRVDLKVVLLGHQAVGKTSLITRFIYERFNEKQPYQTVNIHSEYIICYILECSL